MSSAGSFQGEYVTFHYYLNSKLDIIRFHNTSNPYNASFCEMMNQAKGHIYIPEKSPRRNKKIPD